MEVVQSTVQSGEDETCNCTMLEGVSLKSCSTMNENRWQCLDGLPKVEFEDDEEDVEEVEVEQTPKRSVHGRQATAFVPKSKIPTAPQAGPNYCTYFGRISLIISYIFWG